VPFGRIYAAHSLASLTLTPLGKRRPDEDPEKIVKRHIELLHKYNEAKDATQVRFQCLYFLLEGASDTEFVSVRF
jgi:hypothetical protein